MQESLESEFKLGLNKYTLYTIDSSDKNLVLETLHLFQKCLIQSQKLDLYSNNEDLEDIQTSYLRYLSLEFYLQILKLDLPFADLNLRVVHLQDSMKFGHAFMNRLKHLDLVSDKEEEEFSQLNSSSQSTPKMMSRDDKIAHYKLVKELQSKISELNELCSCTEYPDEELQRQLILSTIQLQIQKTFESTRSSREELQMLQEKLKADKENSTKKESYSDRVESKDLNGPLLSREGKPLRPFVITNQRDALKDNVFRPGHNLPTMSIEEFLDLEMKRGNILSGGTEPKEKEIPRDEDEEAMNQLTYKAREWDAFKDDNPRGWGNRHNKG